MTAHEDLAEAIESPEFTARCMRDGAHKLRKRARKLETSARSYPPIQADLMERKAEALYRAAAEIDRAADAYPNARREATCPSCQQLAPLVFDVHGHFGPGIEAEDETFCERSHAPLDQPAVKR